MLAVLGDYRQEGGRALALLLIDLLDVARFQARLGYLESSRILAALNRDFAAALVGRGTLIRVGDGRFFAVVADVRSAGHAVLAGEKLTRVADAVFTRAEIAVKPRITVGIALLPSQTANVEELLRYSQLAAETAREGTKPVVVFDEAAGRAVLAPWQLSNAFAQALTDGELSVYFQPKVSMVSGRPTGVEALMRWLHEGVAVATPDVFIPLAEASGLIQGVTWYSLSNALRMVATVPELTVAVNVTPGMLYHREFIDMIGTAIDTWEVRAGQLTLEITEGALIADLAAATQRLNKLRDMGVRISIDDFGTGYSSLSYFKNIPADELKIDKSFVRGMMVESADQRLVQTIISLARHFKLEVVAEGVEDRQTFDALTQMGCQYAQGFLFSAALGADELKAWLGANSQVLRPPDTVDA